MLLAIRLLVLHYGRRHVLKSNFLLVFVFDVLGSRWFRRLARDFSFLFATSFRTFFAICSGTSFGRFSSFFRHLSTLTFSPLGQRSLFLGFLRVVTIFLGSVPISSGSGRFRC